MGQAETFCLVTIQHERYFPLMQLAVLLEGRPTSALGANATGREERGYAHLSHMQVSHTGNSTCSTKLKPSGRTNLLTTDYTSHA